MTQGADLSIGRQMMKHKRPAGKRKRVWVTPKLTVIDIRETADGKIYEGPEDPYIVGPFS
jgi:hypothetical protein